MRRLGCRRRARFCSECCRVHHMQLGSHLVMPSSAKFVAEQLINARLVELHPCIIHDARHGHQVKIGSEQD